MEEDERKGGVCDSKYGSHGTERPRLVWDSESELPYNPRTWKKWSAMKYNGTEKKVGKAPVLNLITVLALPDAPCNQKRNAQTLPLMQQECALTAMWIKAHRKVQVVFEIHLLIDK